MKKLLKLHKNRNSSFCGNRFVLQPGTPHSLVLFCEKFSRQSSTSCVTAALSCCIASESGEVSRNIYLAPNLKQNQNISFGRPSRPVLQERAPCCAGDNVGAGLQVLCAPWQATISGRVDPGCDASLPIQTDLCGQCSNTYEGHVPLYCRSGDVVPAVRANHEEFG